MTGYAWRLGKFESLISHGDTTVPELELQNKKYPNKLRKDCHEREKWQRLKQMRLGKQIPYR